MDESKHSQFFKIVLTIVLGFFAFLAIKSLFEDDNSKIVTKRGKRMLSDEEEMKEVNNRLNSLSGLQNEEIVL